MRRLLTIVVVIVAVLVGLILLVTVMNIASVPKHPDAQWTTFSSCFDAAMNLRADRETKDRSIRDCMANHGYVIPPEKCMPDISLSWVHRTCYAPAKPAS